MTAIHEKIKGWKILDYDKTIIMMLIWGNKSLRENEILQKVKECLEELETTGYIIRARDNTYKYLISEKFYTEQCKIQSIRYWIPDDSNIMSKIAAMIKNYIFGTPKYLNKEELKSIIESINLYF